MALRIDRDESPLPEAAADLPALMSLRGCLHELIAGPESIRPAVIMAKEIAA